MAHLEGQEAVVVEGFQGLAWVRNIRRVMRSRNMYVVTVLHVQGTYSRDAFSVSEECRSNGAGSEWEAGSDYWAG